MKSNLILRIHGIFLVLLGLLMSIQTLIGNIKGIGPLNFLFQDPLRSVGLFEAYLLASFSGLVFILLSGKYYKREWHLLPVLVHSILLITNIIFWEAYSLAGIVTIGYVATSAHLILSSIELISYIKLRNYKSNFKI